MINEKLYDKVRIAQILFYITPSSGSSVGTGATDVDISSLNAKELLGITFNVGHNWMVCGTEANLTENPKTLRVYGYRLGGPNPNQVPGYMTIMYVK